MGSKGLLHEVWVEDDGGLLVCLAGPGGDAARGGLGASARRIGEFWADSDLEARRELHRFMRWPPCTDDVITDGRSFGPEARGRQRLALAVELDNPALAVEPEPGGPDRLLAWRHVVAKYREASSRAPAETGLRMLQLVEHLAALPVALRLFPITSLLTLRLSGFATYPEWLAHRGFVVAYQGVGLFGVTFDEGSSSKHATTSTRSSQLLMDIDRVDWVEVEGWIFGKRMALPTFASSVTLGGRCE